MLVDAQDWKDKIDCELLKKWKQRASRFCTDESRKISLDRVNSLWRMWNNGWGPILLYWRLISHPPRLYKLTAVHTQLRRNFRAAKVDIERAFHSGVLLLESNPGGNSPTDEQEHQRRCHGLISDLPLCIEALSFTHHCTVLFCRTFVISFSSSGWWIVANYCRPVCIAPNYASLCC